VTDAPAMGFALVFGVIIPPRSASMADPGPATASGARAQQPHVLGQVDAVLDRFEAAILAQTQGLRVQPDKSGGEAGQRGSGEPGGDERTSNAPPSAISAPDSSRTNWSAGIFFTTGSVPAAIRSRSPRCGA